MNLVQRMQIRFNPNCIDNWDTEKLNREIVQYSMENGYNFNAKITEKLIGFASYRNKFKTNPQFIDTLSNWIIEGKNEYTVSDFRQIYTDDREFTDILLSNESLAEKVMEEVNYLNIESLKEVFSVYPHTLEIYIKSRQTFSPEEIEYIASVKTPKELSEAGIYNSQFTDSFVSKGNPQDMLQLIEILPREEIELKKSKIKRSISENIEKFLPFLDEFEQKYKEKAEHEFIDEHYKQEIIKIAKEKEITYSKSFPSFMLADNEYFIQALQVYPELIKEDENRAIEISDEVANGIAKTIKENGIKLEGVIPYKYLMNKTIFDSIISNNPSLLENKENLSSLPYITANMTDQEVIEYYKNQNIPFNALTSNRNRFLLSLECLKNDYMTLAETREIYSLEEYKSIYEAVKENFSREEILKNPFLSRNPYFIEDCLKNGENLEGIDWLKTDLYEEVYPELLKISLKKGIRIPEPEGYKGIIHTSNDNQVFVYGDSLENIQLGMQYIKEQNINQDLIVCLRQGKHDEYTITDNIEFFTKLSEQNININFQYEDVTNLNPEVFKLDKIIADEKFMEMIATDISSKGFSPLEKFIAVHDIAKNLKPYKKELPGASTTESRSLYKYLNNSYMVCAGYSDFIANIGHRIGEPYVFVNIDSETHARNYVNIVDEKYHIDGFYATDATWDAESKNGYNYLLMTTDEGRESVKTPKGYDDFFTATIPSELEYMNEIEKKRLKDLMMVLEPDIYKQVDWKLEKDEDAKLLIDYFQTKVNNSIEKTALLDATMQVKRKTFKKISEEEYEDMRMQYSTEKPFCEIEGESLYGKEKYEEYLNKRYETMKGYKLSEIKKGSILNEVVSTKLTKELKDNQLFSDYSGDQNRNIYIEDEEQVKLVISNLGKVEELGFSVDKPDEGLWLTFPKEEKNATVEDKVQSMTALKSSLYEILGLTKRKSQTEKLGKETLEEQKDTKGKKRMQNVIYVIRNRQMLQEGGNR